MDLTKKIRLPQVDNVYFGKCHAVLEINLDAADTDKPVFSVCGEIYDKHGCASAGQCIDTIASIYPDNKFVQRVHMLWQNYHLNDMHAGCVHQRDFEHEDYTKHKGCHCDICNYTYGTSWIYAEIPAEHLAEIKEIFKKSA